MHKHQWCLKIKLGFRVKTQLSINGVLFMLLNEITYKCTTVVGKL
jgi:hypothetical protein